MLNLEHSCTVLPGACLDLDLAVTVQFCIGASLDLDVCVQYSAALAHV